MLETITSLFQKPKPKELAMPSFRNQTPWECGIYQFPKQPNFIEYFNCGLLDWKGQRWLITRKRVVNQGRAGHNRISFWLMKNNQPIREYPLRFRTEFPDEHHEDPRCIIHKGVPLLHYCNFRPRSFAHQCVAGVSDSFQVPRPIHVEFGKNDSRLMGNAGHEKNWIYFSKGGSALFVYQFNPHVVCRVEGNKVVENWVSPRIKPEWEYGEIRGGTPPVLVGDEYISFFHSSIPWRLGKRRYYMGAYSFMAEAPFRITSMTTRPLLCGSELDPRNMGAPLVIFPQGAILDRDKWLVTFGVNDCRCGWIRIPHSDLSERMVKV